MNLYDLKDLTQLQVDFLHTLPPTLHGTYLKWQEQPLPNSRLMDGKVSPHWKNYNDFLQELAPWLEDFLAQLFGIEEQVSTLQHVESTYNQAFFVKRQFIQRHSILTYGNTILVKETTIPCLNDLLGDGWGEVDFIKAVTERDFLNNLKDPIIMRLAHYGAWATLSKAGKNRHPGSLLFHQPSTIVWDNLVVQIEEKDGCNGQFTPLDFGLRDPGFSAAAASDQANYCIRCHPQGKDSCAHGHTNKVVVNPLGVELNGCPLGQNISLMNSLKIQGYNLGALGVVMIDNPMVAATGHRICNDCMTSCIFQKQEGVNVPAIETQILHCVLALDFGFEIYSLLSRWNPLNLANPLPHRPTGKKVLVVGMGPAGFTLAHYLLNQGHEVVGIDGLKIEALPPSWLAANKNNDLNNHHSKGNEFHLIKHVDQVYEDLEHRLAKGFGGVSEYGITNRWDKNALTLIRLMLERRSNFTMVGGVRLGSNLTLPQAFDDFGFDHVSLCIGAGHPKIPKIPGIDATGVRLASDFLMTLQLLNAWQENSGANLLMELPVIVIGGGLTAMDAACEAMAYYPKMVKKIAHRWKKKSDKKPINRTDSPSLEDDLIMKLIEHYRQFCLTTKDEWPNLLRRLGGVTIIYRAPLSHAPSYRYNAHEIQTVVDHGITVIDETVPLEILKDSAGHVYGVRCLKIGRSGNHDNSHTAQEEIIMAARCVIIATGTNPNDFVDLEEIKEDRWRDRVTIVGDADPIFSGSVVKAMASAKKTQAIIEGQLKTISSNTQHCHSNEDGNVVEPEDSKLKDEKSVIESAKPKLRGDIQSFFKARMIAVVVEIKELAPSIIELTLHAPQGAKNFRPGQFFRLESYHNDWKVPSLDSSSSYLPSLRQTMEPLALTGSWVDLDKGLVGLIILEVGASSRLCRHLTLGDRVVLMGPTGTPTEIPNNGEGLNNKENKENILLIGGGLGNAVLFSIAKAMKDQGHNVLYIAGYRTHQARFYQHYIENNAHQVIWCVDPPFLHPEPYLHPSLSAKPQEDQHVGDDVFPVIVAPMIDVLRRYSQGQLNTIFPIGDVERVIVIGSDGLMACVCGFFLKTVRLLCKPSLRVIASINSPMQCMMKGICGQCIQRHVDPISGEESFIFSCITQDQDADHVDWKGLRQRLQQNQLLELLYEK